MICCERKVPAINKEIKICIHLYIYLYKYIYIRLFISHIQQIVSIFISFFLQEQNTPIEFQPTCMRFDGDWL